MGLETRATLELGLEFALNEFVGSEVSAVWGKSRVGFEFRAIGSVGLEVSVDSENLRSWVMNSNGLTC